MKKLQREQGSSGTVAVLLVVRESTDPRIQESIMKHIAKPQQKTSGKLSTIALSGFLALAAVAASAQTNPPPAQPSVPASHRHGAATPAQMIKQSLNLTDDQAAKLEPLLKAHQDKIAAMRRDATLTRQQRIAKLKEIQAATESKISQSLTPEQAAKWHQMRTGPAAAGNPKSEIGAAKEIQTAGSVQNGQTSVAGLARDPRAGWGGWNTGAQGIFRQLPQGAATNHVVTAQKVAAWQKLNENRATSLPAQPAKVEP